MRSAPVLDSHQTTEIEGSAEPAHASGRPTCRALRGADPDAVTVTDIAKRYGFWQHGRFAVEYHSPFGGPRPPRFSANPASATHPSAEFAWSAERPDA
jgi:hypothetical protein